MTATSSHLVPRRRERPQVRESMPAAIVAVLAALTLAACGPRDETPLAGGSAGATASPANAATTSTTPAAAADPRVGSPVPPAASPAPPAVAAVAPPAADYGPVPMGKGATAVAQVPTVSPTTSLAQAGPDDAAPSGRVPRILPAPPVAQAPAAPRYSTGSITSIEPIRERPKGSGAGAVIGGVLGAVVGNQFGHGLGRAAMTGAAAAGGAIAGNNLERNYKESVVGYRVHVRLDNGRARTFERRSVGDLRVGDRVRLDAHGFHRG
jgi:uncharacterized protein YcfJ